MQAIQAPRPGPGHFGARSLAASRAIGAPALRAAAATGAAGEPHCDRRAVLAALATSLVGCPGRDARAGEEAVAGGPPAAAPPAAAAPPPTTTLLGERLDGPENFSIFAPLGYDLVLLAAAPGAAVSGAWHVLVVHANHASHSHTQNSTKNSPVSLSVSVHVRAHRPGAGRARPGCRALLLTR